MHFNHKIEKWLPHTLGLLLFIIIPLFVFDRDNDRSLFWMYSYFYQLLFMIVAFYVNYLILVPRLFFSKKKVWFFVVIAVFATLMIFLSQHFYDIIDFDSLRPIENKPDKMVRPTGRFGLHPKLVDNFFLMILVLGFSSGMAIIQQLRRNEARQKEIEKARVDSELAFLKNQISPHFFFNALNSIYALIAIDGDEAQKAVEKLSGLMRYLIYESDTETVELQKEFDFTLKYIELMQKRLSSKVELELDIDNIIPYAQISPLLFIPFVENAFKHGISYRGKSFISIKLKTNSDNVIFECRNSVPENQGKKESSGGVGIANIKQRLNLIYNNDFSLKINQTKEVYEVLLTVPLDFSSHE